MTTDTKPGAMPEWVLVPREPTDEMARAMVPLEKGPPTHRWRWIWHELITASPPSPVGEEMWNACVEQCAMVADIEKSECEVAAHDEDYEWIKVGQIGASSRIAASIRALKRQSGE